MMDIFDDIYSGLPKTKSRIIPFICGDDTRDAMIKKMVERGHQREDVEQCFIDEGSWWHCDLTPLYK